MHPLTMTILTPILALTTLTASTEAPTLTQSQRDTALQTLITAAARRDFVGIHAAEALLALKEPLPVRREFLVQRDAKEPKYRIGVFRVLARCDDKEAFTNKIRAILIDPASPDRVHAIEALAKLDAPIATPEEQAVVDEFLKDEAVAPFAWWRLLQAKHPDALAKLNALTNSTNPTAKARAAYILTRLPDCCAETNPTGLNDPTPGNRYSAAMTFVEAGGPSDIPTLLPLMSDPDEDVRVASSFALLSIDNRSTSTTKPAEAKH